MRASDADEGGKPAFNFGSDLLLMKSGGEVFALELKIGRGVPTATQLQFLKDMQATGAVVAVAYGQHAAIHQLETWGLLRGHMT